jgi:hypothetical protein
VKRCFFSCFAPCNVSHRTNTPRSGEEFPTLTLAVRRLSRRFPIYTKREEESLWDISERLLNVLELSHPNLITQSSVTWPRARRVASNAGAVLPALGFQLTEVEDLLFNTLAWEKSGRFDKAITRCPEAAPAVSYFREEYLPLRRSEKLQLTGTFLDHVYRFSRHPSLRLPLALGHPGLTGRMWNRLGRR